ncbi:MAG: VCBS repeat-containing protein [Myxococcales bacterium]|nr:VCBS repeat-containing protein [Myxococcales bacterium]MCB9530823.1 VCBS repeat-containing protein [Myxococcales bacterium]
MRTVGTALALALLWACGDDTRAANDARDDAAPGDIVEAVDGDAGSVADADADADAVGSEDADAADPDVEEPDVVRVDIDAEDTAGDDIDSGETTEDDVDVEPSDSDAAPANDAEDGETDADATDIGPDRDAAGDPGDGDASDVADGTDASDADADAAGDVDDVAPELDAPLDEGDGPDVSDVFDGDASDVDTDVADAIDVFEAREYSDVPDADLVISPLPDPTSCVPGRSAVPSPSPIAVSFVDVAATLGIGGVQWVPQETMADSPCGEGALLTGGAAIADYDDDGDLDVFYPRLGAADRLYRNDGDRFTDVAPELGIADEGTGNAAAWVDIDADGDLDLFVASLADSPNRMYVQRDGGFFDEAGERGLLMEDDRVRGCGWMYGATFGDADGDGDLDLFQSRWIPSGTTWGSRYLENDGAGHFSDRTLDVGLQPRARSVVFGSIFSDFDADGDADILLTADFGTSKYFVREGDYFYEVTREVGLGTDENGMGSAVGDVDGDGDLDVFVTAIFGETREECGMSWGCEGNRLYLNDGGGSFADCTGPFGVADGGWGWGAALWDFDNDGDLDLGMTSGYDVPWPDPAYDRFRSATARYHAGGLRLWENDGSVPMQERSAALGLSAVALGRAYLPFDMDRDGDLDLFVVNNHGEPLLFRSEGAESRAWLTVVLREPDSLNTYALGARVDVQPIEGGAWMRRDLTPGGAMLSSRPPELSFGLGELDSVARVRVTWPDGGVTELRDVDTRQLLVVTR